MGEERFSPLFHLSSHSPHALGSALYFLNVDLFKHALLRRLVLRLHATFQCRWAVLCFGAKSIAP